MDGERDIIQRVYSRAGRSDNLAMWGTLYVSRTSGKVAGWVIDSWSDGLRSPRLRPRMHWVTVPDHKLYSRRMDVDHGGTLRIEDEDTEAEPERVAFVRAMLAQWQRDWLDEEAKKL